MDAKRTIKTDVKLKDLMFKDGELVEFETGDPVNLLSCLEEVYKDETFTISCTTKTEEVIELEV